MKSRILASDKINFGVFEVRMPESSFGDPEVLFANAKTKEITDCYTNNELAELIQKKHIYSKIVDYLGDFQITSVVKDLQVQVHFHQDEEHLIQVFGYSKKTALCLITPV